MLFQHTPNGLKWLEGTPNPPPPQRVKLTGYEPQMEEILPGQALRWNIGPPPFLDKMVAGEKYELFWPGAEYALWAWGTIRENSHRDIGANQGLLRAVILGEACCSLTCVEHEDLSYPEPDKRRVEKSRRIPETPCISVFLEGPSEISKTKRLSITMKIIYEGLTIDYEATHDDAKPIIIHDYPIPDDHHRLQCRSHDYDPKKSDDDPQWKTHVDDERNEGWIVIDEPDVEVW